MKNLKFTLYREKYLKDRTLGRMELNGVFYGYTLEDTVRPKNIKISRETAIEEGVYDLSVRKSNRFKELRVFVDNVPNFSGVQIHGGNTPEDTEGCVLLAKKRVNNVIYGSLKTDITKLVKKANSATLEIINLNQI